MAEDSFRRDRFNELFFQWNFRFATAYFPVTVSDVIVVNLLTDTGELPVNHPDS